MSSTAPSASASLDYRPGPRRWRALTVTLTAGLGLLDVSIVAVALPSIGSSLGSSSSRVQWVVPGYALTFGPALALLCAVGFVLVVLILRVMDVRRAGRDRGSEVDPDRAAELGAGVPE